MTSRDLPKGAVGRSRYVARNTVIMCVLRHRADFGLILILFAYFLFPLAPFLFPFGLACSLLLRLAVFLSYCITVCACCRGWEGGREARGQEGSTLPL